MAVQTPVEVRIDGKGKHGLAEFSFEKNKEKAEIWEIGELQNTGYTSAPLSITFTGQAIAKQDGSWGVDWDSWCDNDEEHAVVMSTVGRKDRLTGVVIDTIGTSYTREDGRLVRDISGKVRLHTYE